jgi:hypothetical protein
MSPYASGLSAAHAGMLRASAISDDVIHGRGYRTVDDPAFLAPHGFNQRQRRLGIGLFIPIYGVNGSQVTAQFRPDNPPSTSDGRIVKYETPANSRMRLDVHPRHIQPIQDPNVELWITEGIKKADALTTKSLCTIGLLGVWNWRGHNQYGGVTALGDWEQVALKGRNVVLCFDNDYRENTSVLLALHRLAEFLRGRGATVQTINLPSGPKLGVDDFLAQGHTLEDLRGLKSADLPEIPRQTQAEVLLTIAESRAEFLYTEGGERLGSVLYGDGHREVYDIGEKGSGFRDWLIVEYRQENRGKPPGSTALAQAMEAIGAGCRLYGRRVDVFTRLAEYEGKLYLDLANKDGAAVEIDAEGWRLVKNPPVYFYRPPGMLPLPNPLKGESINILLELFGLDPQTDEAKLILAWLIGTLHPKGPYTVLNLRGEHGTRKTTIATMLRNVVDANVSPVRKMPKDDEALVLAAKHGHVVALDNLSYLPDWLRPSKNAAFGPNSLPDFWSRPYCPIMAILDAFWAPMRRPKKWASPLGQFGRPRTGCPMTCVACPQGMGSVVGRSIRTVMRRFTDLRGR